uniref:Uncharacterized protein n=1 Tax=Pithovirus LCPAC101 TaxID=2506586 RepID=A0A481Z2R3_9VIRU|nr:MAG: hypothetical protein LCPAC101_03470 [Pithovirus LCPAC101]
MQQFVPKEIYFSHIFPQLNYRDIQSYTITSHKNYILRDNNEYKYINTELGKYTDFIHINIDKLLHLNHYMIINRLYKLIKDYNIILYNYTIRPINETFIISYIKRYIQSFINNNEYDCIVFILINFNHYYGNLDILSVILAYYNKDDILKILYCKNSQLNISIISKEIIRHKDLRFLKCLHEHRGINMKFNYMSKYDYFVNILIEAPSLNIFIFLQEINIISNDDIICIFKKFFIHILHELPSVNYLFQGVHKIFKYCKHLISWFFQHEGNFMIILNDLSKHKNLYDTIITQRSYIKICKKIILYNYFVEPEKVVQFFIDDNINIHILTECLRSMDIKPSCVNNLMINIIKNDIIVPEYWYCFKNIKRLPFNEELLNIATYKSSVNMIKLMNTITDKRV